MAPVPQKPCIKRPPVLSSPEVSSVLAGPVAKKGTTSRTGLLVSLGLHACVIAAACAYTFMASPENSSGDDGASDEAGDFEMSSPAATAGPTAPFPQQPLALRMPVILALNSTASMQLPPVEPMALAAPNKQTSLSPATQPGVKSTAQSGTHAAKAGGQKGSGRSQLAKRDSPVPPPKLLHHPPPRYPTGAKAAGKSGTVSVLVHVRGNGSAASASIYHSSGSPQLDQAAMDAARGWTFSPTPSLAPGKTVAVVVLVTFAL